MKHTDRYTSAAMTKPLRKSRTPKTRHDASCGVVPVAIEPATGVRRYLLIQHHAGHWGFPKGHPERGETEVEAARRELREETGLAGVELLAEPRMSESYIFRDSRGGGGLIHKRVAYFIGIVASTHVTPQVEEISDYAWGTFDETLARLSFKEARRILTESEAFLARQVRG